MKFCKDCKHHVPNKTWNTHEYSNKYAHCARRPNPVNAEPDIECSVMRAFIVGPCGRGARLFEPKETA
jgi:hypothetical protein